MNSSGDSDHWSDMGLGAEAKSEPTKDQPVSPQDVTDLKTQIEDLKQKLSVLDTVFGDDAKEFLADQKIKRIREKKEHEAKSKAYDEGLGEILDSLEKSINHHSKSPESWYIDKLFWAVLIAIASVFGVTPNNMFNFAIAHIFMFIHAIVYIFNVNSDLLDFNISMPHFIKFPLSKPSIDYQPSKTLIGRATELLKKEDLLKYRYSILNGLFYLLIVFVEGPLIKEAGKTCLIVEFATVFVIIVHIVFSFISFFGIAELCSLKESVASQLKEFDSSE